MVRCVLLVLVLAASTLAWGGGPALAQRIIHVAPDGKGPPAPGGIGSFFNYLFGIPARQAPPQRVAPRRLAPRRTPAAPARAPAIRHKPAPPSIFVTMFGDRFADELAGGLSDALADRPDIGI